MQFTTEEIKLCKSIAEKHRKEIKEGDYLSFIDKIWLVYHITGPWITVISKGAKHEISTNLDDKKDWFPLWQISDCLEYLFNNGYVRMDIVLMDRRFVLYLMHGGEEERYYEPDGDTILEACLKAILRDLEEKS